MVQQETWLCQVVLGFSLHLIESISHLVSDYIVLIQVTWLYKMAYHHSFVAIMGWDLTSTTRWSPQGSGTQPVFYVF